MLTIIINILFNKSNQHYGSDTEVLVGTLAEVTQLVERQSSKLKVAGSGPVFRSLSSTKLVPKHRIEEHVSRGGEQLGNRATNDINTCSRALLILATSSSV